MIKLKQLIKENRQDFIDRLFILSDWDLDEVAERVGYDTDFNKQFWSQHYLPVLYHSTTKENYEKILKDGVLKMKEDRRGATSNRHIGPAVFTTSEEGEVSFFKSYYGPIVLSINTKQMKSDGYTPEVAREPDWDRAFKLSFIINRIKKSNEREHESSEYVDSSDQNTEYTVIVYGNIPVKYLSVVEEN
jgi:hypothetical protein